MSPGPSPFSFHPHTVHNSLAGAPVALVCNNICRVVLFSAIVVPPSVILHFHHMCTRIISLWTSCALHMSQFSMTFLAVHLSSIYRPVTIAFIYQFIHHSLFVSRHSSIPTTFPHVCHTSTPAHTRLTSIAYT